MNDLLKLTDLAKRCRAEAKNWEVGCGMRNTLLQVAKTLEMRAKNIDPLQCKGWRKSDGARCLLDTGHPGKHKSVNDQCWGRAALAPVSDSDEGKEK